MKKQTVSKSFILSIIFLFLIIISSYVTFLINSDNKYQTKESVLGYYLQALETHNKNAILELVPSTNKADNAAQMKIDNFAGKTLGKYTAIYRPTESTYSASFDIINEDKTFVDNIFIKRDDEMFGQKWVLMLGVSKDAQNIFPDSSNVIDERDLDMAIKFVQDKYPDYKDYPSNSLPPKSIKSAFFDTKWYLAFVQEGSGLPILSANCFTIDKHGIIDMNGKFEANGKVISHIDPKSCVGN